MDGPDLAAPKPAEYCQNALPAIPPVLVGHLCSLAFEGFFGLMVFGMQEVLAHIER